MCLGKQDELKIGREQAVRKEINTHLEHTTKYFYVDYFLHISAGLMFSSPVNSIVEKPKT